MRTMTLNMKGEFHLCAFSGDNKFLATAGGHDMMLVVWKWNAEKVVAMSRVHPGITRIHFVPRDSTLLSVSGPQYLRFWRCTSDSLRELPAALPKQDAVNWADHAWMGARPAQTGASLSQQCRERHWCGYFAHALDSHSPSPTHTCGRLVLLLLR